MPITNLFFNIRNACFGSLRLKSRLYFSNIKQELTRVVYALGSVDEAFQAPPNRFRRRWPEQRPVLRKTLETLTPTLLEDVHEGETLADAIVREELTAAGLDSLLQQVPVVTIPHGYDKPGQRSVVLRPFLTTNFMTGSAAKPGSEMMPLATLHKIIERLLSEVPGIGRVLYDLTGKPPGTTEWE